MGKNISAVQFSYPYGIYLFVTGEEDCCFGTIVISDGEDSVIPSTQWQFSDKIKGYSLKGAAPGSGAIGYKEGFSYVVRGLVA
jgi:hypothetical protein